jgi:plastocyanin
MNKPRVLLSLTAIALLAASCQKKEEAAPAPAPVAAAPVAAAPPKAGPATRKGVVKLAGPAPEMAFTKRDADPFCARTPMKEEEVVVAADGGLKNVVVRITKGIDGNYEPPMTNAVLDQTACMYRPRVLGIMAGQSLLVRNNDQTLHNVHTYKGASTLFNMAEVPGLPPIAKTFKEAGDILKFKCDVHPWMTAYVAVSNNPFFAVTGADGSFVIPKVPAGTYTFEAWHERFGTKTAEVKVLADQATTVAFSFEAK